MGEKNENNNDGKSENGHDAADVNVGDVRQWNTEGMMAHERKEKMKNKDAVINVTDNCHYDYRRAIDARHITGW
ncbi:hypothetical protein SNEBB_010266 [Seison nebaliae]|nr:hypothetical protein SNEBB_010266 [Seison nebaliae]